MKKISEYNLAYTVGVRVEFDNWVVQNMKKSVTEATVQKFIFMIKGYDMANGTKQDPPTIEELAVLPAYVIDEISAAVVACEKAGAKRTVEAKSKNGNRAGTSD